ncbi:MAG TPA: homoprotocatechuate degradation operon regulator HpaR, partial [Actinobacteria bacterium]|nr:homoprotocatechuate degradation operon regulator HpaR [Actinomycetota bacterium]
PRLEGLPAFEWSLPLLLLRAREAVMQRFRPILAEFDVTEQQWRVLRVLADESELAITQVAEQCVLLGPSVTRIVKALEDRELVRRRIDGGDRRRILVSITGQGRDLVDAVTPQSLAVYSELFAELDSLDTERLLAQLETLAVSLETRNGATIGRDL